MKIGILGLNINTEDLNYGAILHSWAFCEALHKIDSKNDVEVIDYIIPALENFDRNRPVLSYLRMRRWTSAIKILLCRKGYLKRLERFRQFAGNMQVSQQRYTHKTLEEAKLLYNCLICESDVIWSPRFFGGEFDSAFFLALKNMKEKKKIIYAASMANADFASEEERVSFAALVKYPDFISCREQLAVDYIRDYCGMEIPRVLDPVLLLKAQDYEPIMAPRKYQQPYLLLYLPLNYNGKYQQTAKDYAKKHGLQVIELSYYFWNSWSHTVVPDAGVEDFLSLIKNAEVVFTNSFHAVCFSCLFHKDFYVFERKTGKKTEDFCVLFGLEERYMNIDHFAERSPIDFSAVDKRIEEEKVKSIKWLTEALESDGRRQG